MKKIAFVLPHLYACGVTRSLINLIDRLPPEEFDITVLAISDEGEFAELLPERVILKKLPLKESLAEELMIDGSEKILLNYLREFKISKLFHTMRAVIKGKPFVSVTANFDELSEVDTDYDTAICFDMQNPFLLRYTAQKINAAHRVAWLHKGLSDKKLNELTAEYLNLYDSVFAVSKTLAERFAEVFPNFDGDVHTAYDYISIDGIRSESEQGMPPEYPGKRWTTVLSVGRLQNSKGYALAINACARIKAKGIKLKWFVLGQGEAEYSLREQIKLMGLEEEFLILGNRANPYPYIANCDIFAMQSKSEGYGMAITEAKALCKPIVCMEFDGVSEQLENGVNASVFEGADQELEAEILRLIDNPQTGEKYSDALKSDAKIMQTDIADIIAEL